MLLSYIIKRLAVMAPTLLGILTLVFIITQFVPGGPVDHILSQLDDASARAGLGGASAAVADGGWSYSGRKGLTAQDVEQLTALYGFDKPLLERYGLLLGNFLQFDFGQSYFRNATVWSLIQERLPVSIGLGAWTFILTYAVSLPLGVAKAVRAGSRFDLISSLLVLVAYAIPGFVLGVLLILLFGGGSFWDIFPLRGLVSENWSELSLAGKVADYLWHVTLPVIASVASNFAIKTLMTKNTFLDELGKQYVLTARAKGLSERKIMWKHIFRNALLPLITAFPITFISAFFTGSLLIETLFSLDGIGLLSFESIRSRDFPVVLATLYLFALIGLVTKLIGDIGYVLADPRIRFNAQEA